MFKIDDVKHHSHCGSRIESKCHFQMLGSYTLLETSTRKYLSATSDWGGYFFLYALTLSS